MYTKYVELNVLIMFHHLGKTERITEKRATMVHVRTTHVCVCAMLNAHTNGTEMISPFLSINRFS